MAEGLKMTGVDAARQEGRCEKTNLRVFKTNFGRHPRHLARVWRDLQLAGIMTRAEAEDKDSFVGFLVANNFLNCCEGNDARGPRLGIHDMKKLIQMTWAFVDKLALLADWKIKCPSEWPVKFGATVDGTQARGNEPRTEEMRRDPKNFCCKCNFAGVNFQIVLATWTNEVLCARADPGSTHDMTAIRKEFIDMVPDGCRVIADSGHTGKTNKEKEMFSVKNNLDEDAVAFFKACARARQEQLNSRIKNYECMKKRFIHGVDKHKRCFLAVLVLIQCAIEDVSQVGEPLDTL